MHVTALGQAEIQPYPTPSQMDVVASTFPDAPIRLPSADLIRQTDIIEQTERPRFPPWLLIGGGLAVAYLLFIR
jgi:hypothetical protein